MTILFDVFPATGHLNASFPIASRLKSAGNKIVYCGEIGLEQVIVNNGFEFIPACSRFIALDKYEFFNKGFLFLVECFISAFTQSRRKQIIKNADNFKVVSCHLLINGIIIYLCRQKLDG
jgi:hypothetical protein